MQTPLRILISCGGTGGHVFPGIATGQILQQRGHAPSLWLSGRRQVENETLRGWDGPVFRTGAQPLRLSTLTAFAATLWRVWCQMRLDRPDVVLAMGCYASVPPVLAARLLGIPVVLHEANAVPGKAVAFLARYARVTALSFGASAAYLPGRRTVCTGMPVRTSLAGQPPLDGFAPTGTRTSSEDRLRSDYGGQASDHDLPAATAVPFTVFITGGSLGAHAVNELACEALLLLHSRGTQIRAIHQCGPADEARLRQRYTAAGVDVLTQAFLQEMGRAYTSADLVICRAGAATCFELCLCGVPAIMIPLPTAVRDHQRRNAEAMVQCGGALLRKQADLTPARLAAEIDTLRNDPARCATMRRALQNLAAPDAAEKLAEQVTSLAACRT
ncbi:MAG: undecaprenyldiphospho-muramoylpentapeptide beta-N-acetylglucosaminyltransferase [Kiritimatiellia bacterium]